MKKIFILFTLLFFTGSRTVFAQEEDLLKLAGDSAKHKEYVNSAFKSARVIMSHSMEMLKRGVLDFRILHRFGRVNGGAYEFFGLDGPATVRLGLDYGLTDDLTIGIGRSTLDKELDGFIKYRIIHQATGPGALPFSLVAVAGSTLITLHQSDPAVKELFSSRLAYYGQLIIGRKLNSRLTLQLMPSFLHRNLVQTTADHNDLFAAGIGGRAKLTRRLSLTADYYYVTNRDKPDGMRNPLSIGFDIETGGHVFQLHFTNSKGMNERSFLADTQFNWGDGDIFFGFNISRAFQLKKKKEAY